MLVLVIPGTKAIHNTNSGIKSVNCQTPFGVAVNSALNRIPAIQERFISFVSLKEKK
jgi:hypothetical protein